MDFYSPNFGVIPIGATFLFILDSRLFPDVCAFACKCVLYLTNLRVTFRVSLNVSDKITYDFLIGLEY